MLQGASVFTPRANPHETSLLRLIKPAPNGYIPRNPNKVLYDGPDVHNKCFDPQPGDVDVLAVVSARRHLAQREKRKASLQGGRTRELADTVIVPGRGWEHKDEYPGDCDGTYNSICGRHKSHTCPLIGHHDSRGAIVGNEYSGWLVMEIPEMQQGLIILKIVTWFDEDESKLTKGWTSVNNEKRRRLVVPRSENASMVVSETDYIDGLDASQNGVHHGQRRRRLDINSLPANFLFDYAINGQITTLDRDAFVAKVNKVQRVVETLTLLDDPGRRGREEKVEVAIRMRQCGRKCTLGVTHLYWA